MHMGEIQFNCNWRCAFVFSVLGEYVAYMYGNGNFESRHCYFFLWCMLYLKERKI